LKKHNGFTLTEVLVTLVIISILAVTAIMMYTSQVRKGRRTDAINTLASMSLAEERYRSTNTTYGTLAQAWGGVTTSSNGYYTLSISGVSATGYTLTAVGTGDQANDAQDGTSCTTMQMVVSNGAVTKTPTACWPQ
jgi:type IV pilus assembly protein PilE